MTDKFHQLIGLQQYHFHFGNTMIFNYYHNKVNRNRKQLMSKFYSSKMDNLNTGGKKYTNYWNEKQEKNLWGMENSLCDGDQCSISVTLNN